MPILTTESEVDVANIPPPEPEAPRNGKAPKPSKLEAKTEKPEPPPKGDGGGEALVEEEAKPDGKAAPRPAHSAVMEKLKKAQDMEVRDWLDAISGEAPMKVQLLRQSPKSFIDPASGQTVNTGGNLTTFDRAIDPEEVQRIYGGGTYQIVIQTKGLNGKWQYFGAKTFEIAGDPNLNSIPRAMRPEAGAPIGPQKDPADGKMLDKMTDFMIGQMRDGAGRQPQVVHQGVNDATIQALLKPLEIQIQSLQALLRDKDAEMARIRETAGKDPFRDKMLETMMGGESSRIEHMRVVHEAELRTVKENARADIERERDRHQRDIDRLEAAHTRELTTMKSGFDRELSSMKSAHEQAIALATQKGDITKMVLDREVSTLEKQLDVNRTELQALRSRKDQSIKEKVEELAAIKELVGDGDEEEQSTLEKIIGAVGNLPAVVTMAERAAGGGQRQPQQQVAAAQPEKPKIVRDLNTGEVSIRKADGTLIPVKKKPVPVTTADGQQFELPPVDPEQVKQAIQFMEGAFRSDTDAKTFAASARPFLTENMLGAIRVLGISEFLSKVGKISGASPLATMRGRQWTKKVAAALLGEEEAPQNAAPAPDDAQPPAET